MGEATRLLEAVLRERVIHLLMARGRVGVRAMVGAHLEPGLGTYRVALGPQLEPWKAVGVGQPTYS